MGSGQAGKLPWAAAWNTGVTVNALHLASPMDTEMVHGTFGYTMSMVEEGAEAVVRLAASPEVEGARKRLWALSEELPGRLLEPVVRR